MVVDTVIKSARMQSVFYERPYSHQFDGIMQSCDFILPVMKPLYIPP